jgi:DNA mismatch repair protein MutS
MTETAHILHHATSRSLLILDEIGKGTSTSEGLSLAWAVALYIVRRLGARALFATHFYELTALEALVSSVQNFHLAVRETAEGVVFLRQVVPGGTSKSYGLHVARLAGLPQEVLGEAEHFLQYLEQQDVQHQAHPWYAGGQRTWTANGTHACQSKPSDEDPIPPVPATLMQQLLALDICQITPLHALTMLHALQQQARALVGRGDSTP